MVNINAFSLLPEVTAAARSLAVRIFNHHQNEESIVADRKAIMDWLLADPFRKPEDIQIPEATLSFMEVKTRLSPEKVLEYAEKHQLPLEEFRKMIDAICVPTSQTLRFLKRK